jgi:hypothetical protein
LCCRVGDCVPGPRGGGGWGGRKGRGATEWQGRSGKEGESVDTAE